MEDFYVKLCMICLYTYYVQCVLMFCILGKNGCTLFTHLCPLPSTTAKQWLDCDSGLLKCRYLILVQDGIIIEFYIQLYVYIVYWAVQMLVICSKHENNVLICFSSFCSACFFCNRQKCLNFSRKTHHSVNEDCTTNI